MTKNIESQPCPLCNSEANNDTLRIDWLDAQEHIHALQWHSGTPGTPVKTRFYNPNRVLIAEGNSLRQAVDVAMQAQGVA